MCTVALHSSVWVGSPVCVCVCVCMCIIYIRSGVYATCVLIVLGTVERGDETETPTRRHRTPYINGVSQPLFLLIIIIV